MQITKTLSILATLLSLSLSAGAQVAGVSTDQVPYSNDYGFGLDLSFVRSSEQRGQVFYDTDAAAKSPWEIFRSHGYNWGRLMICNEPSRLGQGIDYVVEGAKSLKAHGYHFALDYMISDGWSNPMTQPMPQAWKDLTPKELEKAMYDFVYSTMSRLKAEGVLPEIVQIGNEISNGTLWPSGRVFYGEAKKDKSNWAQFTAYIKAGIKAVKDVSASSQIMLHADFGGDVGFSEVFFSKMREYGVDFDIAGFSYYPWSHGTLMDFRDNLAYVTSEFGKKVMVIETGYYSTPSTYFELSGHKGPFPETPEGQKQWFRAVNDVVMAVPGNMGLGTFWWEPMQRGRGFFDDETGVVKPIVDAFEDLTMPAVRPDGNPRVWDFEKELYRDPVYGGPTDPMVCYNPTTDSWYMYYTSRRSNVTGLKGVEWVHGTPIGMAESKDGGASWTYIGDAEIDYHPDKNPTYWAPEVIYHEGLFHMYLTYVPGVFEDWGHPRDIVHLTSRDGRSWKTESVLPLSTHKVIDACIYPLPNGGWRLWYNEETDNKSIYYADTPDLYHFTDKGKVKTIEAKGEGPNVFELGGQYFMIVDEWKGLSVYSSSDLENWTKQEGAYLIDGQNGQDKGNHADVQTTPDGRAFMFYFTDVRPGKGHDVRVAELRLDRSGRLRCDSRSICAVNLDSGK